MLIRFLHNYSVFFGLRELAITELTLSPSPPAAYTKIDQTYNISPNLKRWVVLVIMNLITY